MKAVAPTLMSGLLLPAAIVATPPDEPVPPSVYTYGYGFGANDDGAEGNAPTNDPALQGATSEGPQRLAPYECENVGGDVQVCEPETGDGGSAGPSPSELAATEWRRLPIPVPSVRTAPPRGSDGLVGLPEWFWVTNWKTLTGRASARGVWAAVVARPQSMTIDPGDGRGIVRCTGPGIVYDESRRASRQRTDCSYTYSQSSAHERGGAYRVRVTVVWGGSWTGSDGSSGVLPPLSRSTTFRLRVAEAQGLYGRGDR